ncbi:MAG: DNA mismatch repair protein MutS [Burkholderiales bacterium RIFCSPLOWO2_12_FULL_61_40]|nr:MAG: DNA mismatch repair protein MutS [Burkholderiales bacterium RIFCSPLOWO2_12_FULL_61_40]
MTSQPLRLRCLADLKLVQQEMRARAQREALMVATRALEAKRLAAQHNLFQMAAGAVTRLRHAPTADLKPTPPEPEPMQRLLDEEAALREALSDEVDVSTLLDTDEHLSFRRPGVGMDVARRLRRGEWSIQRQVDLHGLRSDEAREALGGFIRESHQQGIRCVRVVHGKGLGSPSKTPVLKDKVHRWLVQKSEVLAFVQAPRAQGGAGALVVLLQPLRQR